METTEEFGKKEAERLTELLMAAIITNRGQRLEFACEEARRSIEALYSEKMTIRSTFELPAERKAKELAAIEFAASKQLLAALAEFSNRVGIITNECAKKAIQIDRS